MQFWKMFLLMHFSCESQNGIDIAYSMPLDQNFSESINKVNTFINTCIAASKEFLDELEGIEVFIKNKVAPNDENMPLYFFDRISFIFKCLLRSNNASKNVCEYLTNLKEGRDCEYADEFFVPDNIFVSPEKTQKLKDNFENLISIFGFGYETNKLLFDGCNLLDSLKDKQAEIRNHLVGFHNRINTMKTNGIDKKEIRIAATIYLGAIFHKVNFLFTVNMTSILSDTKKYFKLINDKLNNEFEMEINRKKHFNQIFNTIFILKEVLFPLSDYLKNNSFTVNLIGKRNMNDKNSFNDLLYYSWYNLFNMKKTRILRNYNLNLYYKYISVAKLMAKEGIFYFKEPSSTTCKEQERKESEENFLKEIVIKKDYKDEVISLIKKHIDAIRSEVQKINEEIISYVLALLKMNDSKKK